VILVAVSLFYMLSIYMLVVSKLLPATGIEPLDWIQQDQYYCYLVPATIPVTVGFIYFNWLSLKFFRHN
jgi:phosphatidylinositol N-acetylglucosaminyltransferase subunit Y